MSKRLRRSRTDRVLGGVCGGIGNYLDIDPIIVRLFFVLLSLGNGVGVFLYLVLWVVIPSESAEHMDLGKQVGEATGEMGERAGKLAAEIQETARGPRQPATRWIGIGLLVAGAYYLLRNLNVTWLRWLDVDLLWPLLLIVAGGFLLIRRSGFDDE
jgi:phage shock protein C